MNSTIIFRQANHQQISDAERKVGQMRDQMKVILELAKQGLYDPKESSAFFHPKQILRNVYIVLNANKETISSEYNIVDDLVIELQGDTYKMKQAFLELILKIIHDKQNNNRFR